MPTKNRIKLKDFTLSGHIVTPKKPVIDLLVNNDEPLNRTRRRDSRRDRRRKVYTPRFKRPTGWSRILKGISASALKVPYTDKQFPDDTDVFSINEPLNGKAYLPSYKLKIQRVSGNQQLCIKLTEATEGEGGTLTVKLQSFMPPKVATLVDAASFVAADHNVSFEIRFVLANNGIQRTIPFTEVVKTPDGFDITAHINSFTQYNQLVAAMLESSYGCQLFVKRSISFAFPIAVKPEIINNLNTNPELLFTKKENSNVRGQNFTRFFLSVKNWELFSNDLFTPAPTLPPCGLNKNASRTWVDIFNENGKRLNGFCGLYSNESLKGLWFSIAENQTLPKNAYIALTDREKNKTYTSNVVNLTGKPTPLVSTQNEQLYSVTSKEFIQEEPFHFPIATNQYIYGNTNRAALADGGFVAHRLHFGNSTHVYLQEENNPSNFYFLPDSFVLAREDSPPFAPLFKAKLAGKTLQDLSASISYEAEAYFDANRWLNALEGLQKKTGLDKDDINLMPLSIKADKLLYKLSVPGRVGYTERNESLISLEKIKDTLPAISLPVFEDLFDSITSANSAGKLQGHVEVTLPGISQPAIIPVNLNLTEIDSEVLLLEQSTMPIIKIGVSNNTGFTLRAQGLVATLQDGVNVLSCSKANLPLPLTLAPNEKTDFILIPQGLVQNRERAKIAFNWEGLEVIKQDGSSTRTSSEFKIEYQVFDTADLIQVMNASESSLQFDNVAGLLQVDEDDDIPLIIKKLDTPNILAPGDKFSFLALLSEEVDSYSFDDFIFQWIGLKMIPDKGTLFDMIVDTSIGATYELDVKISLFINFKTAASLIRLIKVEFKNKEDGPIIKWPTFDASAQRNEVTGNIEANIELAMPVKDYIIGGQNAGQYFYRITLIKETDAHGNTKTSVGEWQSKSGSLEITNELLPK